MRSDPDLRAAVPVADLLALASSYARAADALMASAAPADAAGSAPARFCTVHAVELYLDAFLRGAGESSCRLRTHAHNLGMRAALAIAHGLPLRRKTALHLAGLGHDREHVALRHGPARPATDCEVNRLRATLREVADAVISAVPASAVASDGRP